jgi:aromatic ring-cleaving dioxygenase
MSEIENFHAHVYYDPAEHALADKLCAAAGERFGIKVGRMHDNPVGPHPRGSCQLTIPPDRSPCSPTPRPATRSPTTRLT